MAEKTNYKLAYYDIRALAEPIRWIFHYVKVPFDDYRIPYDFPKWFGAVKNASTVGQIPVLYVNGKELCQSTAISRFLAAEFGLLGDNNWDIARGDEVISLIFDIFLAWRTNCFERDQQRRIDMKPIVDDKFKIYYGKFNQLLSETEGDFLNGHKVTHADFWLANFISVWDDPLDHEATYPVMRPLQTQFDQSVFYLNLTKDFPLLRKHKEMVHSIPAIKEWVAKRPKSVI